MPTSRIETTQHFEWDTPWSMGFLVVCCIFLGGWILWQLIREGQRAQSHWTFLFVGLRGIVAGVLIWMILGPTSVLVQKESHPRTLAVYVDSSSSMEIQDQPDEVVDRRWEIAALNSADPIVAADRIVLYSAAMRQQLVRLTNMIEQHQPGEERLECAAKWKELTVNCRTWLESDILKTTLKSEQQELLQELSATLKTELMPLLESTDWISGTDPGDREDQLRRMTETGDQFAARCRVFADGMLPSSGETRTTTFGPETTSGKTRLEMLAPVLRNGIQEWRRENDNSFQMRIGQFSDKVSTLQLASWEQSLLEETPLDNGTSVTRRTDMSELLKQIRDETAKEELAAVVILTDGRHTANVPEDPRDLVSQFRVPLYLVPIGRGDMKRDLMLHHLHAPTSVIEKDRILIEGIVTAYRCAGESCEVQLLEGDTIIQSQKMTLNNDQEDQRFRFEVPTDKPGRREFKVQVPQISEEHSADNNSGSLGVDVVDAVLRILIADNRATWEHQHLINLFKRQEQMEYDELKFSPRPIGTGKRQKNARFPETVDEWSEYRVVILGDVGPRQLTQQSQNALREYIVQRGGCLIVIAGRNEMPQAFQNEPLEKLLPVEPQSGFHPAESGYRIELTAEGKTTDVMQLSDEVNSTEAVWREMSSSMPVRFLSSYHKPKPSSHVLLNAISEAGATSGSENPAFLSWHQVGAGRVAYLSSPSTCYLRMRNGDRYFHRFWGQLLRWIVSRTALSGSNSVRLLTDKSNYQQADASQITVELMDEERRPVLQADPRIDVIHGGDVRSSVALSPDPEVPGRYRGQFVTETPGRYMLRARGPHVERLLAAENYTEPVQLEIEFEANPDREQLDVRSDRPLLEFLAEQSGGLILEPTAVAELYKVLSLKPRIQETSQRTALWDRWWCLWVILGCLTLEWIIRKQVGLA